MNVTKLPHTSRIRFVNTECEIRVRKEMVVNIKLGRKTMGKILLTAHKLHGKRILSKFSQQE